MASGNPYQIINYSCQNVRFLSFCLLIAIPIARCQQCEVGDFYGTSCHLFKAKCFKLCNTEMQLCMFLYFKNIFKKN